MSITRRTLKVLFSFLAPRFFSVSSVTLWLALSGCHGGQEEDSQALYRADLTPRVEVIRPARTTLARRLELSATVEAMEKADLCVRIPGVVDYLPADVDIGRKVTGPRGGRQGEVLVQLAVPDLVAQRKQKEALLDQARKTKAQVEEAQVVAQRELEEAVKQEKRFQAEVHFLTLQHTRVAELVQRGAQQPERVHETKKQLEAAEAALEAARAAIETRKAKLRVGAADLEVAQAKIEVADADVDQVEEMIRLATVTAPFDGIIARRLVDRGATVRDPSTPLLTVVRTDKVRVLIDIPAKDVPLIATDENNPKGGRGDPVRLRVPGLAGIVPNGEFQGHLTRMSGALDPNTRTLRAEVHLDNPDGHLKPGMYGTAIVTPRPPQDHYRAMVIPSSALLRQGNRAAVLRVARAGGDPPTGVIERLDNLEIGLDDGRQVEVIGDRLTEKHLILLKGNSLVRPGDRVVVVER